ncbi:MAG TPA: hypothetical protein VJN88_00380 [Ktedonobacterales bacterium]|nr:hypothetical protein [Ktedonobacterales bacterium]
MTTTSRLGAHHRLGGALIVALVVTLSLSGCDSAGKARSSTPRGATRSPSVTRTVTTQAATPTGAGVGAQTLAWISNPASGKPEIWASIGGAAPRHIAQAVGDDCSTATLGPPVISPDGQHIAVVGGAGCGDGQSHGSVFVVNVATGSFDPVPNTDALTNARSVAWLNDSTLLISGANVYTLGSPGVQSLPNFTTPGVNVTAEAVVRGDSLFYLTTGGAYATALSATLHRYSLSAHHDLNTISLGSFELPQGRSPGDFHFQGWDASPDGMHVVYQVTSPGPAGDSQLEGISSSRVMYANADGSGATRILSYMSTTNAVRMRFSPDGSQVAVTEAEPAPDIITGCVSSAGGSGDPCFHVYTLTAGQFSGNYPAWAADGHSFLVESNGSLYRFTVGTANGILAQPNAINPWTD